MIGKIFLVCTTCTAAFAQISTSEFIGSAVEVSSYKNIDDQLSFLKDKPYRLSPIQKLEFRTQNRELLSYQQEYGLRFTPANPWEIRGNSRYFSEYQSLLSLEKSLILRSILITRYQQIIDVVYYRELLELTKRDYKQLEEQLNVMEKQAASSLFDAEDYVKMKVALVGKDADREEVEMELLLSESVIAKELPVASSAPQWTQSGLITLVQVKEIADSLQEQVNRSAQLAYQQQKISLRKSEYLLEKANVNVGFLQAEYDRRRVEQNRTPYNISMGITIPITNPNKGDMAKKKLDVMEAEYELKDVERQNVTVRQNAFRQLQTGLLKLEGLNNKITELEKSALASQLTTAMQGNPLAKMQFEESVNKLYAVKLKLWRKVMISYIEYLGISDHLQKTPLINFLSPSLETVR